MPCLVLFCFVSPSVTPRAGFLVGGPVIGVVLAAAANYGSKRDNEAGVALRAVAANAIEAFNFLTSVNSKYDVTGKLPWDAR